MNFEIKLPLFEGPFDLLLFFIQRDELDIHDIPISKIIKDFLTYIHQLETMNIEVASEFILVAATLMRIKAKMLLPRPALDEFSDKINTRDELVKHLLEYKKYKSVIWQFSEMETNRLNREKRGNIVKEIKQLSKLSNMESELQNIDLYKLIKVYQKVLKLNEYKSNKVVHKIKQYPYTISGQKNYILNLVSSGEKISFTDIVKSKPEKIIIVFNFLAILELLQLQKIILHLGEGFNNFWIEKVEEVLVN